MGRIACIVEYKAVSLDNIDGFYDWLGKHFTQTEIRQNTYIQKEMLEEILKENPEDAEKYKNQIAQLEVLIAKHEDFELDLS
ncbi:MAG: hypothetical protein DRP09_10480 [Candidatus Thorarchaeota archaeon]|nr:MAG: hypothetical protein DRP09_10480 [Candidatus Thorarchaeota archaeon]